MRAGPQPGSGAGKAFLYMLVGLVLWAAVALFVKNNDYFIDHFGMHMGDWWIWMLLAASVFVGSVFWVQGHRVYAMSKGQSALIGLALAFLLIVGLLILIVMPPKKRIPAAPAAEPTPPPGGDQA
jgi:amino acid transporter